MFSGGGGLCSANAGATVLGGSGWAVKGLGVDPPAGDGEETGLGNAAGTTGFLGGILGVGRPGLEGLDTMDGTFLGTAVIGVGGGGFLGDIKLVPERESCGAGADLRMGVNRVKRAQRG